MSNDKYDPQLLELSETLDEAQRVTLIIGLSRVASDDDVAALQARGLNTRSVIGEIITGSALSRDLSSIAELDFVLKIEMSRAMSLDDMEDDQLDDFTE